MWEEDDDDGLVCGCILMDSAGYRVLFLEIA